MAMISRNVFVVISFFCFVADAFSSDDAQPDAGSTLIRVVNCTTLDLSGKVGETIVPCRIKIAGIVVIQKYEAEAILLLKSHGRYIYCSFSGDSLDDNNCSTGRVSFVSKDETAVKTKDEIQRELSVPNEHLRPTFFSGQEWMLTDIGALLVDYGWAVPVKKSAINDDAALSSSHKRQLLEYVDALDRRRQAFEKANDARR